MDDCATLARRWFEEVWNSRRTESIVELAAPGCVGHQVNGDLQGIEALKRLQHKYLTAVPDLHIDVEDVVAQGGSAVVRWRLRGTHSGPGLGVAPAGRTIDLRGMTWMRCERGQIVEAWDGWNFDGMIRQLSAPADD